MNVRGISSLFGLFVLVAVSLTTTTRAAGDLGNSLGSLMIEEQLYADGSGVAGLRERLQDPLGSLLQDYYVELSDSSSGSSSETGVDGTRELEDGDDEVDLEVRGGWSSFFKNLAKSVFSQADTLQDVEQLEEKDVAVELPTSPQLSEEEQSAPAYASKVIGALVHRLGRRKETERFFKSPSSSSQHHGSQKGTRASNNVPRQLIRFDTLNEVAEQIIAFSGVPIFGEADVGYPSNWGGLNYWWQDAGLDEHKTFPLRIRKKIDQTTPFFFQAAADFRESLPSENVSLAVCPHLLNMEVAVRLPGYTKGLGTVDMFFSFLDVLIVRHEISAGGVEGAFEEFEFAFTTALVATFRNGRLVYSGVTENGWQRGAPPMPIPQFCCSLMPWMSFEAETQCENQ
ncbi:hypothetical protein QOT17_018538 [Balamuthia mandrillaris]